MIMASAIYSATGIFSKRASQFPPLSLSYIANFSGVLLLLGVYAVMWQIILKRFPLTVAFMWKSVGLIFGLFYSWLFFHEEITMNNIMGIAIIIVGLTVVSWKR